MAILSGGNTVGRGVSRLLRTALIACFALSPAALYAQRSEYEVKAAFLLNFARFVEWPSDRPFTDGKINLAVVGNSSVAKAIGSAVNGSKVGKFVFHVTYVAWSADLAAYPMVFVPATESTKYAQLSNLAQKPILVVGESPGFASKYGMFNFFVAEGRVRFEINNAMAKRSNLVVSSQLLQIAKVIQP